MADEKLTEQKLADQKLSEDELDNVAGGTREEFNEIGTLATASENTWLKITVSRLSIGIRAIAAQRKMLPLNSPSKTHGDSRPKSVSMMLRESLRAKSKLKTSTSTGKLSAVQSKALRQSEAFLRKEPGNHA